MSYSSFSQEYTLHLKGRAHARAMQRLALRQRSYLSRLRLTQRTAQREIDESLDDDTRSNYCRLCMLRFKQDREEHNNSSDHSAMHKLMYPYCSICKIRFRRMMGFEHHRCSVEHLRVGCWVVLLKAHWWRSCLMIFKSPNSASRGLKKLAPLKAPFRLKWIWVTSRQSTRWVKKMTRKR